MQRSPKTRKMPTVVSIVYFFIDLPPHIAPQAGDFFLIGFCRIDDGLYFRNRLAQGDSRPDNEFDATPEVFRLSGPS